MEQLVRAHDLAIAALLGETIYNFGELVGSSFVENFGINYFVFCVKLQHPILDSLNGTEHEWIKNLLFTFNEGDIGKYESLAPLFGREVSINRIQRKRSPFYCILLLAHFAVLLWISPTKNLPHGSH